MPALPLIRRAGRSRDYAQPDNRLLEGSFHSDMKSAPTRRKVTSILCLLLGVMPSAAMAGASGAGSFDNDDAMDWVTTLTSAKSPEPVKSALDAVLHGKEIDAPEGSIALAAAEVVAAAKGKANKNPPPDVATWIKRQPPGTLSSLAPLALRAVERVRDPTVSELRQLWMTTILTSG